jgi:alpha-beta hydrolase superfamily lysophospholipase
MMSRVRRIRTVTPILPTESGRHHGLAFTSWLPPEPRGGVVVLHGAGSAKESHHDFARALLPIGFASVTFDQRGHGESDAPLDGRAAADVAAIADLLRARVGDPALPVALRGSSLGGYLAIVAAESARRRPSCFAPVSAAARSTSPPTPEAWTASSPSTTPRRRWPSSRSRSCCSTPRATSASRCKPPGSSSPTSTIRTAG